jgi:hypothetical protein
MRSKGLGTCARQLLLEVSSIRSMDVILPVKNASPLRPARGRPTRQTTAGPPWLGATTSSKIIQNVVEKIAWNRLPSRLNARPYSDNCGTSISQELSLQSSITTL